jgi:hypothetical protein
MKQKRQTKRIKEKPKIGLCCETRCNAAENVSTFLHWQDNISSQLMRSCFLRVLNYYNTDSKFMQSLQTKQSRNIR